MQFAGGTGLAAFVCAAIASAFVVQSRSLLIRPMKSLLRALSLSVLIASTASAQLFDNSLGETLIRRSGGFTIGQAVTTTQNHTLGRFGFYGNSLTGGSFKFFIFDGSNTNLLYSGIRTIAASTTQGLEMSDPFSLSLAAGTTYNLGILGDVNTTFDFYISNPQIITTQNGITNNSGNLNYGNFANPAYVGPGFISTSIRLEGPVNVVPEPSTYALMGAGLLGLGFVAKRRKA